ncbi:uncharacterized protein LOC105762070 [Gossypium raimondii]|uniref:uncharacterized protein LOC105762070 n=1 Tax=Gossypium raimondii TaxID=29730 RepID=UPI00063AA065|nr:uncharacterized protein LOC105762070 [Gossypium raimondii]
MTPTPLLNIPIKNKLNRNNYKEWKRSLIVVLSYEKVKIVLDSKCTLATQAEARKCWEEFDEIARCYILASMTNTLYKQLESCKTAKAILDKLEVMFEGQATLVWKSTITSLMNAQQKSNTLVKEHIITLIGYFTEAVDNEANLDQNTQIEIVFKSLSKDFAGFQAAYNLGNKHLTLTQPMNELQSYELMLNDGQLV